MTNADRCLLTAWLMLTVSGSIAFLMPGLMFILVITVIGIPFAILIAFAPGLWLYATPTLLIYAALRRWRRASPWRALLAVAAVPPFVVGMTVPAIANIQTKRQVAALLAHDDGKAIHLPAGSSVTYVEDRGLSLSDKCGDQCQHLLLSGTASSYTEVPLDQFYAIGHLPQPVTRYSLAVPDRHCRNDRLEASRASEAEAGPAPMAPFIWDKLSMLGKCLHAETVRDIRSDFVFVQNWNYDPSFRTFDLRNTRNRTALALHPIGRFHRWETFQRNGRCFTPIFRRTRVEHALIGQPLWLVAPVDFDSHAPAHWSWTDQRTSGLEPQGGGQTHFWPWIANDVGVYGLRDTRTGHDKGHEPT